MVYLELRCAPCNLAFDLDLCDDEDTSGRLVCSKCNGPLIIDRFERAVDKVTRAALANIEERVSRIENHLADASATDEEPFTPPETS